MINWHLGWQNAHYGALLEAKMRAEVRCWLAKHTKLCLVNTKHDKLSSWEPKHMLKCPLQWQEHTVPFFFFAPPFKKSVHATAPYCDNSSI